MTNAEYERLYLAARRQFPYLTLDAMRGMQRAYEGAIKLVAKALREAEAAGYAEITTSSWAQIEAQLNEGARLLREALEARTTSAVTRGIGRVTGIDEAYLIDVSSLTGGRITAAGARNLFVAVNQSLIQTMAGRIYQSGYSFSERIWRVGAGYSTKIKDMVSSGLAANMPVEDIARVLEHYVRRGAATTLTRYGDLVGAAFRKRLRSDISYPALRLVRSELYANLQQSALWAGRINPGCTGLYDWIRSTHEDWGCACPELAEGSPYTYENAPSYPHPNCLCRLQPRLMDRRQFVDDLERWGRGESVPYLDKWEQAYYKPLAA